MDVASPKTPEIRWFSSIGSVVVSGTRLRVFVGGLLLGDIDESDDDRGQRNVLVVTLAKAGVRLGRLAMAFDMSESYLRELRRKEEAGGLGAVLLRSRRENASKVDDERRAAWHEQFAAGLTPKAVYREQPKRWRLSYPTVWRAYREWKATRATAAAATAAAMAPTETAAGQLTLWSVGGTEVGDDGEATADESTPVVPMTAQPVRGARLVQHVGSWLMLALTSTQGLHADAELALGGRGDGLRIALDAIVCALALGEGCVEGVRRLATPTGAMLLRAERVPTASGVRRLLGRRLAQREGGAAKLDASIAARLIRTAAAEDAAVPAVFYVDNHLRPYTGEHVVRKGWRMQDRRVLPGTSDYYVHDEDGRPLLREAVPSHDSLGTWLVPLAARLRSALGRDARILLAFDRGGAYAEPLAALRDADFEWVTYERKPYPELPATAFTTTTICGEEVGLHESRQRNLGGGRGRVRRIALRVASGRQVNVLASSTAESSRLVEILWNRWRQENGFKHGVERWGINQLDGRSVVDYPPDTIIPNPARSRLDRALRLARVAEGDARRELARRGSDDPRRSRAADDLAAALAEQERLEWLRPKIPRHAALETTELAGVLVHHVPDYKRVLDVVRIACANAESELATMLAPHLTKPREAKKVVANLLAAPGKVAVTDDAIHVRLAPAANVAERRAIKLLFGELNDRKLTLPGDRRGLPLRLEIDGPLKATV